MNNKTKKILIFLAMLALVALVILWFTAFNKSTLVVSTGLDNYNITINHEEFNCDTDPCAILATSGVNIVRFTKDGYNDSSTSVNMKRWGSQNLELSPKIISKFEVTENLVTDNNGGPAIQAPFGIDPSSVITSAWNESEDKFLFLDANDNKLKIKDKEGEEKLITVLTGITQELDLLWSKDENKIIASEGKDIYFIQVDIGSRKKNVLSFTPNSIQFGQNNQYILLNNSSNLVKIDWDNFYQLINLDVELNLEDSLWISDSELITYTYDEDGSKTTLWTYNLENGTESRVVQKFNFKISEMNYNPDLYILYVLNELDNNWYEITIK